MWYLKNTDPRERVSHATSQWFDQFNIFEIIYILYLQYAVKKIINYANLNRPLAFSLQALSEPALENIYMMSYEYRIPTIT